MCGVAGGVGGELAWGWGDEVWQVGGVEGVKRGVWSSRRREVCGAADHGEVCEASGWGL